MSHCPYGMDFPSSAELLAPQCGGDTERIREEIGADSLGYLSIEKMLSTVSHEGKRGYCTGCFTGEYPVPPEENMRKEDLEL